MTSIYQVQASKQKSNDQVRPSDALLSNSNNNILSFADSDKDQSHQQKQAIVSFEKQEMTQMVKASHNEQALNVTGQQRELFDDEEKYDSEDQIDDEPQMHDMQQPPPFTCSSSSDEERQDNESDSSYFESMSSASDAPLLLTDNNQDEEFLQKYSSSQQYPFLFSQRQDPLTLQQNSEALLRQEHGGVVVYDSQARMIGNSILQTYYEGNAPAKVDFNLLFAKEELAKVDQLFHKEPRERDFANDFDKFIYKHLPKFQPEREFGGSQTLQNQYTINVPQQENILIFDSRFENGNLRRAMKVNNVEYNLLLENDVNTKGHTQWYYFKVIHRYKQCQKITFNILNLAKPQSLYQQGMKPCIFSKRQNELYGKGWFRGGEDIKYFQNDIPRKTHEPSANQYSSFLCNNNGAGEGLEFHFSLSFMYEFDQEEDEVWFAHAIPYTYTDLQVNLKKIKEGQEYQEFTRINALCKTLSGSPCPLLTITSNVSTYMDYYDDLELQNKLPNVVRKQMLKKYRKAKKLYKQSMESKGKVRKLLRAAAEEEINTFCSKNIDEFRKVNPKYQNIQTKMIAYIKDHFNKKAIILTSRVHPGEPQSSYMLKGTIDYLLSDQAADLRKNFVFCIVPMLNVDGVIYGNYRCSLLGVDLNRKWVQPNVFLHPTIFYAKQLVKTMNNDRRVLVYCDMHGHSRKQNAFFYACTYKNFEHEGRIKNAELRIIPLLCCHKNELFKFTDCRF